MDPSRFSPLVARQLNPEDGILRALEPRILLAADLGASAAVADAAIDSGDNKKKETPTIAPGKVTAAPTAEAESRRQSAKLAEDAKKLGDKNKQTKRSADDADADAPEGAVESGGKVIFVSTESGHGIYGPDSETAAEDPNVNYFRMGTRDLRAVPGGLKLFEIWVPGTGKTSDITPNLGPNTWITIKSRIEVKPVTEAAENGYHKFDLLLVAGNILRTYDKLNWKIGIVTFTDKSGDSVSTTTNVRLLSEETGATQKPTLDVSIPPDPDSINAKKSEGVTEVTTGSDSKYAKIYTIKLARKGKVVAGTPLFIGVFDDASSMDAPVHDKLYAKSEDDALLRISAGRGGGNSLSLTATLKQDITEDTEMVFHVRDRANNFYRVKFVFEFSKDNKAPDKPDLTRVDKNFVPSVPVVEDSSVSMPAAGIPPSLVTSSGDNFKAPIQIVGRRATAQMQVLGYTTSRADEGSVEAFTVTVEDTSVVTAVLSGNAVDKFSLLKTTGVRDDTLHTFTILLERGAHIAVDDTELVITFTDSEGNTATLTIVLNRVAVDDAPDGVVESGGKVIFVSTESGRGIYGPDSKTADGDQSTNYFRTGKDDIDSKTSSEDAAMGKGGLKLFEIWVPGTGKTSDITFTYDSTTWRVLGLFDDGGQSKIIAKTIVAEKGYHKFSFILTEGKLPSTVGERWDKIIKGIRFTDKAGNSIFAPVDVRLLFEATGFTEAPTLNKGATEPTLEAINAGRDSEGVTEVTTGSDAKYAKIYTIKIASSRGKVAAGTRLFAGSFTDASSTDAPVHDKLYAMSEDVGLSVAISRGSGNSLSLIATLEQDITEDTEMVFHVRDRSNNFYRVKFVFEFSNLSEAENSNIQPFINSDDYKVKEDTATPRDGDIKKLYNVYYRAGYSFQPSDRLIGGLRLDSAVTGIPAGKRIVILLGRAKPASGDLIVTLTGTGDRQDYTYKLKFVFREVAPPGDGVSPDGATGLLEVASGSPTSLVDGEVDVIDDDAAYRVAADDRTPSPTGMQKDDSDFDFSDKVTVSVNDKGVVTINRKGGADGALDAGRYRMLIPVVITHKASGIEFTREVSVIFAIIDPAKGIAEADNSNPRLITTDDYRVKEDTTTPKSGDIKKIYIVYYREGYSFQPTDKLITGLRFNQEVGGIPAGRPMGPSIGNHKPVDNGEVVVTFTGNPSYYTYKIKFVFKEVASPGGGVRYTGVSGQREVASSIATSLLGVVVDVISDDAAYEVASDDRTVAPPTGTLTIMQVATVSGSLFVNRRDYTFDFGDKVSISVSDKGVVTIYRKGGADGNLNEGRYQMVIPVVITHKASGFEFTREVTFTFVITDPAKDITEADNSDIQTVTAANYKVEEDIVTLKSGDIKKIYNVYYREGYSFQASDGLISGLRLSASVRGRLAGNPISLSMKPGYIPVNNDERITTLIGYPNYYTYKIKFVLKEVASPGVGVSPDGASGLREVASNTPTSLVDSPVDVISDDAAYEVPSTDRVVRPTGMQKNRVAFDFSDKVSISVSDKGVLTINRKSGRAGNMDEGGYRMVIPVVITHKVSGIEFTRDVTVTFAITDPAKDIVEIKNSKPLPFTASADYKVEEDTTTPKRGDIKRIYNVHYKEGYPFQSKDVLISGLRLNTAVKGANLGKSITLSMGGYSPVDNGEGNGETVFIITGVGNRYYYTYKIKFVFKEAASPGVGVSPDGASGLNEVASNTPTGLVDGAVDVISDDTAYEVASGDRAPSPTGMQKDGSNFDFSGKVTISVTAEGVVTINRKGSDDGALDAGNYRMVIPVVITHRGSGLKFARDVTVTFTIVNPVNDIAEDADSDIQMVVADDYKVEEDTTTPKGGDIKRIYNVHYRAGHSFQANDGLISGLKLKDAVKAVGDLGLPVGEVGSGTAIAVKLGSYSPVDNDEVVATFTDRGDKDDRYQLKFVFKEAASPGAGVSPDGASGLNEVASGAPTSLVDGAVDVIDDDDTYRIVAGDRTPSPTGMQKDGSDFDFSDKVTVSVNGRGVVTINRKGGADGELAAGSYRMVIPVVITHEASGFKFTREVTVTFTITNPVNDMAETDSSAIEVVTTDDYKVEEDADTVKSGALKRIYIVHYRAGHSFEATDELISGLRLKDAVGASGDLGLPGGKIGSGTAIAVKWGNHKPSDNGEVTVTFTDSGDKDDIYQLKFVFKEVASPGAGVGPTGASGLLEVASVSPTGLVDGEVDVIDDDATYRVVADDRTPSPTGMQKDGIAFDFGDKVTVSVNGKGVVTINRKGGADGALDAGNYRMVIPVVITHRASGIVFAREVTVTFTITNPVNDQAEADNNAIQAVTTDDYKVEEDVAAPKSGDIKRIYNVHYRAGHSFQTTDELISGLKLKDAVGASGGLGLPGGEISSGTAIAVKLGSHSPVDNDEVVVTFTDSGDKDDIYQLKFVFKEAASPGVGVSPTGASGLNEVASVSPTSLVAGAVDVISDDTKYEVVLGDRTPSPTGMQKDDKDFDFSDKVTVSVSDKGVVTINRKGGDDGELAAGSYQMVIPVIITHKASGIAFTREVTVTFTIGNPANDQAETAGSDIQEVTTADYKVEEDADTVKSGDLKRIYNVHYRSGHSFQTTDELISGLRLKDAVGASGDLGLPGGKIGSGTAIAVKWGDHKPSDNGEVVVTFTDSGDKDDKYQIKFVFKAAASPGAGVSPDGVGGLNEVASGTPTSLVDGEVDVIGDDTAYEVASGNRAPSPKDMQKDDKDFDFSDKVTVSVSDKGVVTINRKGGDDGALDAGDYQMVIPVVITHKASGIAFTREVTVTFTIANPVNDQAETDSSAIQMVTTDDYKVEEDADTVKSGDLKRIYNVHYRAGHSFQTTDELISGLRLKDAVGASGDLGLPGGEIGSGTAIAVKWGDHKPSDNGEVVVTFTDSGDKDDTYRIKFVFKAAASPGAGVGPTGASGLLEVASGSPTSLVDGAVDVISDDAKYEVASGDRAPSPTGMQKDDKDFDFSDKVTVSVSDKGVVTINRKGGADGELAAGDYEMVIPVVITHKASGIAFTREVTVTFTIGNPVNDQAETDSSAIEVVTTDDYKVEEDADTVKSGDLKRIYNVHYRSGHSFQTTDELISGLKLKDAVAASGDLGLPDGKISSGTPIAVKWGDHSPSDNGEVVVTFTDSGDKDDTYRIKFVFKEAASPGVGVGPDGASGLNEVASGSPTSLVAGEVDVISDDAAYEVASGNRAPSPTGMQKDDSDFDFSGKVTVSVSDKGVVTINRKGGADGALDAGSYRMVIPVVITHKASGIAFTREVTVTFTITNPVNDQAETAGSDIQVVTTADYKVEEDADTVKSGDLKRIYNVHYRAGHSFQTTDELISGLKLKDAVAADGALGLPGGKIGSGAPIAVKWGDHEPSDNGEVTVTFTDSGDKDDKYQIKFVFKAAASPGGGVGPTGVSGLNEVASGSATSLVDGEVDVISDDTAYEVASGNRAPSPTGMQKDDSDFDFSDQVTISVSDKGVVTINRKGGDDGELAAGRYQMVIPVVITHKASGIAFTRDVTVTFTIGNPVNDQAEADSSDIEEVATADYKVEEDTTTPKSGDLKRIYNVHYRSGHSFQTTDELISGLKLKDAVKATGGLGLPVSEVSSGTAIAVKWGSHKPSDNDEVVVTFTDSGDKDDTYRIKFVFKAAASPGGGIGPTGVSGLNEVASGSATSLVDGEVDVISDDTKYEVVVGDRTPSPTGMQKDDSDFDFSDQVSISVSDKGVVTINRKGGADGALDAGDYQMVIPVVITHKASGIAFTREVTVTFTIANPVNDQAETDSSAIEVVTTADYKVEEDADTVKSGDLKRIYNVHYRSGHKFQASDELISGLRLKDAVGASGDLGLPGGKIGSGTAIAVKWGSHSPSDNGVVTVTFTDSGDKDDTYRIKFVFKEAVSPGAAVSPTGASNLNEVADGSPTSLVADPVDVISDDTAYEVASGNRAPSPTGMQKDGEGENVDFSDQVSISVSDKGVVTINRKGGDDGELAAGDYRMVIPVVITHKASGIAFTREVTVTFTIGNPVNDQAETDSSAIQMVTTDDYKVEEDTDTVKSGDLKRIYNVHYRSGHSFQTTDELISGLKLKDAVGASGDLGLPGGEIGSGTAIAVKWGSHKPSDNDEVVVTFTDSGDKDDKYQLKFVFKAAASPGGGIGPTGVSGLNEVASGSATSLVDGAVDVISDDAAYEVASGNRAPSPTGMQKDGIAFDFGDKVTVSVNGKGVVTINRKGGADGALDAGNYRMVIPVVITHRASGIVFAREVTVTFTITNPVNDQAEADNNAIQAVTTDDYKVEEDIAAPKSGDIKRIYNVHYRAGHSFQTTDELISGLKLKDAVGASGGLGLPGGEISSGTAIAVKLGSHSPVDNDEVVVTFTDSGDKDDIYQLKFVFKEAASPGVGVSPTGASGLNEVASVSPTSLVAGAVDVISDDTKYEVVLGDRTPSPTGMQKDDKDFDFSDKVTVSVSDKGVVTINRKGGDDGELAAGSYQMVIPVIITHKASGIAFTRDVTVTFTIGNPVNDQAEADSSDIEEVATADYKVEEDTTTPKSGDLKRIYNVHYRSGHSFQTTDELISGLRLKDAVGASGDLGLPGGKIGSGTAIAVKWGDHSPSDNGEVVVTFTDSGDKDDKYQIKFVFKAAASPGAGVGPTGASGLLEVADGSPTSLVADPVDVISDDTAYEVASGNRAPSPKDMQKDDKDFDFSDQVTISVSDKGVVTINRKGGDDGALDAGDYQMVIPVVITHKASGIAFTREVTVTFTIGNPVNDQAEADSSAIEEVTTADYKVEEDADTVKSGDLKRIYNVHYRAGHSFQTTDELISGLRLKDAVGASGDLGLPGGEIGSGTAIAVKWGSHEPSDNGEVVVTFTDSGDKDDTYRIKFVFKEAASPGAGVGPTGASGLNEVADGSPTSLVADPVDVISDDTAYEVASGNRAPSPTGMQKDDSDFDFASKVTVSVSDKGVVTINRKGGDDGALDAGSYRMVIPVIITHKASGIEFTRDVTVTFTITNPVSDIAETDSSAIEVVTTADYKVEEDATTVKSGDLKRIYNVHYRSGHSFQTTDELISGLKLKDAVGASGDLGLPVSEISSGTAIAVKWGDHSPSDNGEVVVTFTDSGDKDDIYQLKFVFKEATSPGDGVGPTGASNLNEVASNTPTSLVDGEVDVISDDTKYEVVVGDRTPSPKDMQKDDSDFDFSDQVSISVSDKGVVTINRKGGADGALDAGSYRMVIPVIITHKASGIAFTRDVTVTFTIGNPVNDQAEADSSAIEEVTTADYKVEEDADTVKSGDLKRIYNVHYRAGHSFQTTDELISGLRLKDAVGASGDLGLPGGEIGSGTAIAVKWGDHKPSDNGEVVVTFTDSGDKDDTYRIKFVFKAAASPGAGVGPTGASGLLEVASGSATSLVDGAVDVISDDAKYEVASGDRAPSPTGMQKDDSDFDFASKVTVSVSDKGVVTINRKGGDDGALDAGSYRMVIPVIITHKASGIEFTRDVTVTFTITNPVSDIAETDSSAIEVVTTADYKVEEDATTVKSGDLKRIYNVHYRSGHSFQTTDELISGLKLKDAVGASGDLGLPGGEIGSGTAIAVKWGDHRTQRQW